MSKLVLHPNLRDSQTPTIDTPPNKVKLLEEEAMNTVASLFPEGTCTECQKITLHGLLETHFGSIQKCWLEYDRDLPTNCPICKLMFDSTHVGCEITGNIRLALNVNDHQPNNDVYTGRRIHEVRMSKHRQNIIDVVIKGQFRIYAEPGTSLTPLVTARSLLNLNLILIGSYASQFVPYWRAPPSNLSDITFQKIAWRIKNCDETHTRCWNLSTQFPELTPQYLPSRVVHVGSETQQPHLHIAQEQEASRYVALSHCWGNIPQVRTLKANIEQYKEAIVFECLSKTFQDALRVTRRLGIEYIWVDSLCIVQDDEKDWLRESKNMGSIYTNAYITIAATSATDGNGGLDSVRPESKWFQLPCDGTDEGKGYMWFTDASWSYQSDLNDAPLNLRGWVLQEKMLSRRIVHFASSQVYWECKESLVGEECEAPIRLPADATLKPSLFWAAVSRVGNTPVEPANRIRFSAKPKPRLLGFYESWRTFICYYSTRTLTRKSDRLIALMGIIRVIEKQTGLLCIDGHWVDGSRQFVQELMWFPKNQRTLSVLGDDRRSRLCSSWSWASVEGPIGYRFYTERHLETWGFYGLKDCDLHLKVIGNEVHVPWSCHPLMVSGMLITLDKRELENDYRSKGRRAFAVKANIWDRVDGYVCFDREDNEPEAFQFTPVYIFHDKVECLALVQWRGPESTERCFERIGTGYLELFRRDGSDNGFEKVFGTCERETYYIF